MFHDYFNYFIKKLRNYDQYKIDENKNSLLQRFQRIRNNRYHNYNSSDYLSPSNSIHNANANNGQNEYKPIKNSKNSKKISIQIIFLIICMYLKKVLNI